MRLVLVNPPIRLPEVFAHYPTFGVLGLLSNAAWLRQHGHEVRVVDAFSLSRPLVVRPDGGGFRHVGAEVDEVAEAVLAAAGGREEPTAILVAVTMFSDMNRPAETLVPRTVRALAAALEGVPIGLADLHVCGMNYFPHEPARTLGATPGASFLLVGEGEPTLPELARRLAAGAPLEGLPRLATLEPGGEVAYDPRPPELVRDLDRLPLPAFDLLELETWFSNLGDAIRADLVHEYHVVERQLPLMTSRGCPFRCSFCTNQVLDLPFRAHSVEYVRRAVRELRDRYRVDRVMLLDDDVNADRQRFSELVRALAEEGVPWDAVNGYRADRLDRAAIRAIRAAGNTKITVSGESGDPELLRRSIRKGLALRSVFEVARTCEEERIPLQVHWILGVPGETKGQVNRTLETATELFERHGAWPLLQHAIPFPGTRLYAECEERGWFVAPPETISGARLELESIIRTPELGPDEVIRMKRAAQHLHAAMQALAFVAVETACDQDCLSCSCEPALRGSAPPTREEVRARLERARFLGARELFLAGGEPTLRADLAAMVAEARELGFERVCLVTNGHGLARAERARELVRAGVSRLLVTLHAARAEAHDAVARREGSFAWTLAGVRQAQAAGAEQLEVVVPVLRSGLDGLPAAVRLAVRLGAEHVHLRYPDPSSPALAAGQVPLWREAEPRLVAALESAPPGTVTLQAVPLCLLADRPGAVRPLPPWALARSRRLKARRALCASCTSYLCCGGFYRDEHEASYGMMEAASRRAPRSAP